MTVNGRQDGFTRADLWAVANDAGISKPDEILAETVHVASTWPEFARQAGVRSDVVSDNGRTHRLSWDE